ncbi:hypothetical protein F4778DRAFT_94666 [Xylariomycetidae sp. FL2044]|nr:hypothetical protein F4778DRAFT_94666 [Xylariomycetidae sp. FL2044]
MSLCIRPISRICQRSRLVTYLESTSHTSTFSARHFSNTSVPYASIRVKKPPTRHSFLKARFTLSDVPPLSFWLSQARAPLIHAEDAPVLTPEACFITAQTYADMALQDRMGWRQRLLTMTEDTSTDTSPNITRHHGKVDVQSNIMLFRLHYVASMIILGPPGPAYHLGTHIVLTLVLLGYEPSVLSLAYLALRRNKLKQPNFAPAVEALEKIASRHLGPSKEGKGAGSKASRDGVATLSGQENLDACTLMGMIYASANDPANDARASEWFRLAHALGTTTTTVTTSPPSPTDGKGVEAVAAAAAATTTTRGTIELRKDIDVESCWQWRAKNALGWGMVLRRQGHEQAARRILEFGAKKLDNAEACFHYAKLLGEVQDDHPDYLEYMQKAAVSGIQEACAELGKLALRRAAEGGGGMSEKERKENEIVAAEWLALAKADSLR